MLALWASLNYPILHLDSRRNLFQELDDRILVSVGSGEMQWEPLSR
jgi:hypothetical protein